MRSVCTSLIVLAVWAVGGAAAIAPALNKQKIESYLRYAEGFASSVKFVVDNPEPMPFPGFYRLVVHLSMGDTRQDKVYYVTADGNHIMSGPVWDLQNNPFIETATHVPTDGPSFGPADAPVTLVVFSDLECPYCREFARTLRENLPRKYPKEVRVIFKDFPIPSLHPWAYAAAEAAHCVGDGHQDVFWEFHDWIFAHQQEINGSNLREKTLTFAREHKLDDGKIAACLDSHAMKPEVEASLKQGRELEVQQTPTFFLNGRTVPGAIGWASLDTLIQMELHRPSFIPSPAK